MLGWLRSLFGRPKGPAVPQPQVAERDSGEDAYETETELVREADPSGEPRIKTDDL